MNLYGIRDINGNTLKISYEIHHDVESNYEVQRDTYEVLENNSSGPIWLTDDLEAARDRLWRMDARLGPKGKTIYNGKYKIFKISLEDIDL